VRRGAAVLVLLALAGCETPWWLQQPQPCEDDYCRQARLSVLQGMINNQQQTNQNLQGILSRVVQPPVYVPSQSFTCSRIGSMTYCN
jgi:hypothetical protein